MKTFALFSLHTIHCLKISQGVYALLSIGGWGGSRFFSSAVTTDANRTAFAQATMNVVTQYNLDGIEIE